MTDNSALMAPPQHAPQSPPHESQQHSPTSSSNPRTHQHQQLEPDIVARLDEIFFQFLNNLCSNRKVSFFVFSILFFVFFFSCFFFFLSVFFLFSFSFFFFLSFFFFFSVFFFFLSVFYILYFLFLFPFSFFVVSFFVFSFFFSCLVFFVVDIRFPERVINQTITHVVDATDSKGEKIHQTLMAKKMQKLDESPDFRPFKFRIQAFVNAFHEELVRNGFTEDILPLRKVKIYLWKSR